MLPPHSTNLPFPAPFPVSNSKLNFIFSLFSSPQGRKTRDATIENLKVHLRDTFIPLERRWMVLFPEGGFLRKRLEVSQKYAAKNNLPMLKNVTLPRIGALKAIMEIIPPHTAATAAIGNNNATAKRTPENGTLRPFGSQGMSPSKRNINLNFIEI